MTTDEAGGKQRKMIAERCWGRGEACRQASGEVETPAMAAEARRETRRGAESDEESDGGDGAQDSERVRLRLRNTY